MKRQSWQHLPNTDQANLTSDEVGFVEYVSDTIEDWAAFMSTWELTKAFHLRVVLPAEVRESLRDWDKFLDRFDV